MAAKMPEPDVKVDAATGIVTVTDGGKPLAKGRPLTIATETIRGTPVREWDDEYFKDSKVTWKTETNAGSVPVSLWCNDHALRKPPRRRLPR